MAVGPNVWYMLEPIVVTGWALVGFLIICGCHTKACRRVANKRRVESMAIGNLWGGDNDGFLIEGLKNFGDVLRQTTQNRGHIKASACMFFRSYKQQICWLTPTVGITQPV